MDELANKELRSLQHLIVVGEFLLDRETIRVWRGSKALQLSMKQFRLLEVFMQHPGEPLPHRTLKERVWGSGAKIEDATVASEIARLRRAIGGRRREAPIRAVRKFGYVFQIYGQRATT